MILILLFVSIFASGLENKVYFSFEEEQKIWDKWFEENPKRNPLEPLYLTSDEEYYHEVEKCLVGYYQNSEFFLVYHNRNINNGVLQTSLIVENASIWNQIDWVQDDGSTGKFLIVETKREIADFNKKLCRRVMKHNFYLGVESYLLIHGSSIYIYIFDKNEIGRFAFYGRHSINPTRAHKEAEKLLRGVNIFGSYWQRIKRKVSGPR